MPRRPADARLAVVQTIYLDGSAALEPDLAGRLTHLSDPEHELVLVAPADHPAAGLAVWARRTEAIPEEPAPGSWYLTADPASCRDRQPGLRTVLVGPRVDGQRPPAATRRRGTCAKRSSRSSAADAMADNDPADGRRKPPAASTGLQRVADTASPAPARLVERAPDHWGSGSPRVPCAPRRTDSSGCRYADARPRQVAWQTAEGRRCSRIWPIDGSPSPNLNTSA